MSWIEEQEERFRQHLQSDAFNIEYQIWDKSPVDNNRYLHEGLVAYMKRMDRELMRKREEFLQIMIDQHSYWWQKIYIRLAKKV